MTEFILDTSGTVGPHVAPGWTNLPRPMLWSDLDPFTQGYVEALFLSIPEQLDVERACWKERPKFSDLAPEALASILAVCAGSGPRMGRAEGAAFWCDRQSHKLWPVYPPLTLDLGDDGKVHLS